MAKEVTILKEDIIPTDIPIKEMTTDCHFVERICGMIDVAKGQSMVKIFDHYHDKGIKIKSIKVAGGALNPKLNDPCIGKDK